MFLALAADLVFARAGVILSPHYKNMGNLHGSEYWTYVLPRRVGSLRAQAIPAARLPMRVAEAQRLGLVDERMGGSVEEFGAAVAAHAEQLAASPGLPLRLEGKRRRRAEDDALKPLEQYQAEELQPMKLNFYGFDSSYHVARYNFVHHVPKSHTPLHLVGPRPPGPSVGRVVRQNPRRRNNAELHFPSTSSSREALEAQRTTNSTHPGHNDALTQSTLIIARQKSVPPSKVMTRVSRCAAAVSASRRRTHCLVLIADC